MGSASASAQAAPDLSAKNCGLLFDRNSALGGNFANDLTGDVVRLLDARIQTMIIERDSLPQQVPAS